MEMVCVCERTTYQSVSVTEPRATHDVEEVDYDWRGKVGKMRKLYLTK